VPTKAIVYKKFRAISTGQLHILRCFHLRPINVVVYHDPSPCAGLKSHLGVSFTLICFQRLSVPNLATRLCSWRNNRFTRGSFDPVLSY
jgi:hypothetical protein